MSPGGAPASNLIDHWLCGGGVAFAVGSLPRSLVVERGVRGEAARLSAAGVLRAEAPQAL